jgi:hypothetical protein
MMLHELTESIAVAVETDHALRDLVAANARR